MINTILVTNSKNEVLTMDLRSPEQSGFFISNITGIGPVKATINESEALTLDGSTFNSARIGSRNIVFDLGFLPNPTIEDTRVLSYNFFNLKSKIEIQFITDLKTVKISGYVESNEPIIFDKTQTTTISIICPDPYFRELTTQTVDFSSVSGSFMFPYSNNSTTLPLTTFGSINLDPQNTIDYLGQVEVGFTIYIHAVGPVNNLSIYKANTSEELSLDSNVILAMTGDGIIAGDDIIISTVKGEKYITLIRGGININILNAASSLAWFSLSRGDNAFYYLADSGSENLSFTTEYEVLYEGI